MRKFLVLDADGFVTQAISEKSLKDFEGHTLVERPQFPGDLVAPRLVGGAVVEGASEERLAAAAEKASKDAEKMILHAAVRKAMEQVAASALQALDTSVIHVGTAKERSAAAREIIRNIREG